MTIINKEGKLFGKVSIIDVLVIIAIIIIGIGFISDSSLIQERQQRRLKSNT